MSRIDRVWLTVAVAGLALSAGAATWLFGNAVVDVILTGAVVWLVWNRATLADRTDQAWDTADQALGLAQSIADHLAGVEEPSSGRHASGQEQEYRWSPREAA